MTDIEYIASKKKGEVLVNLRNDAFEQVKIVFHANSTNQVANSLHFGLKPGHLFIYAKRWGERQGRWLLRDAGYLNYFRADKQIVHLTHYNTLAKQKLFSRGHLRVENKSGELHLVSRSILPIHERRIVLQYDDHSITVEVRDAYIGRCKVYWNFYDKRETTTGWFRQRKTITL